MGQFDKVVLRSSLAGQIPATIRSLSLSLSRLAATLPSKRRKRRLTSGKLFEVFFAFFFCGESLNVGESSSPVEKKEGGGEGLLLRRRQRRQKKREKTSKRKWGDDDSGRRKERARDEIENVSESGRLPDIFFPSRRHKFKKKTVLILLCLCNT